MRKLSLTVGLFCTALFLPLSAHAAVRLDHKKLSVSYTLFQLPNATAPPTRWVRQPNATEPVALRSFASYSVDYDTFEFFEVALEKVEDFLAQVRAIGLIYTDRSSMDYLYFGWFGVPERINTRLPVPIDPKRTPRAVFKPGEHGLYVLQLVAYTKPEWSAIMKDLGVRWVWTLSANGSIVATTPEVAKELNELPWVQFVEPYHPFLKFKPPPTGAREQFLWVYMTHLSDNDEGWEFVKEFGSGVYVTDGGVAGTFPTIAIPSFLAQDNVIGVSPPTSILSPPPSPSPTPVDVPILDPIVLASLLAALLLAGWLSLRS